jgi:phospholipase C
MLWKRLLLAVGAGALGLVPMISAADQAQDPAAATRTATPIEHLVVIFQENISFDHYFATYPVAANTTKGEPTFHAREGTPDVNGLNGPLLTSNPCRAGAGLRPAPVRRFHRKAAPSTC